VVLTIGSAAGVVEPPWVRQRRDAWVSPADHADQVSARLSAGASRWPFPVSITYNDAELEITFSGFLGAAATSPGSTTVAAASPSRPAQQQQHR